MRFDILKVIKDPLSLFKRLQTTIAAICILIPLVFRVCDKEIHYPPHPADHALAEVPAKAPGLYLDMKDSCGSVDRSFALELICKDKWGFRKTLSDYENSSRSYLFGMMYAIAAMLLIYNGVFHYRNLDQLWIGRNMHWYYIISGLSLVGVILFPVYSQIIMHNVFTAIFFIGNFFAVAFLHTPEEPRKVRTAKKIITLLVVALLAYLYFGKKISILYIEWVSLIFIAAHLMYSARQSKTYINY